MHNSILSRSIFIFVIIISNLFISCNEPRSPEELQYIESIKKSRLEKDNYMENDPDSPFNLDEKAHFAPLKYYPVDSQFKFSSVLHQYNPGDTVIVLGTKGEERKVVRYGYLIFNYNGKDYPINVYEGRSKNGTIYHSIWFTDLTTGEETYGVGRYIDFELNENEDYIYTVDFNLAYNPLCAYSARYSCAIPTKEDHIPLAITAGEKNFH